MKLKMDVINKTEFEIELRESRYGVELKKAVLKKNQTFVMTGNSRDTYSEYLVLHIPTGTIKLTSDSLSLYKSVQIIYGPPKTNPSAPATLYWDGEPRNLQSDQNLITLLRNWMAKFFRPSLKHDERPDVEVPVEDKSEPSSAMPHPVGPGSTT